MRKKHSKQNDHQDEDQTGGTETSGGGIRSLEKNLIIDELKRSSIIKKNNEQDEDETGGSQTSSGGTNLIGTIDLGIPKRDDLLPAHELNRLIAIHSTEHEIRVIKQKDLLDARQQLKNQPRELHQRGLQQRSAGEVKYPPHPILYNKSQFSGQDSKISQIPGESNSNTNEGDRNEKKLDYTKQYVPEFTPAPTFSPRLERK